MTFPRGKIPYVEVQSMTYAQLATHEYLRLSEPKREQKKVQVKICGPYGLDMQAAFDKARGESEAIHDVYIIGPSYVLYPEVRYCYLVTGWRQ